MSRRRQQSALLRSIGVITGATLLLGAWLSGCDNCAHDPVSVSPRLGTLEGVIYSAGEPLVGKRVHFFPPAASDGNGNFSTLTDSSGRFSFVAPQGDYLLFVTEDSEIFLSYGLPYGDGALHHEYTEIETLSLGHDPVRVEAQVGAASITLNTPAELNGVDLSMFLKVADTWHDYGAAACVADGRAHFEFDMVPFDTYGARLSLFGQWVELPLETDPLGPDSVEVGPGVKPFAEYSLLEPTTVSGSVTGSWQVLFPDRRPRLTFHTPDSSRIKSVVCEGDGTYETILATHDPFKILVNVGSTSRWLGGDSFSTATVFSPDPGAHIEDVSLVESGLVCRLYSPNAYTCTWAEVMLFDEDQQPVFEGAYLRDTYDRIRISNLLPGTYYLHLRPEANRSQVWCPQWLSQAEFFEDARPIVIANQGEIVELTADLMAGGAIHGKVLGPLGQPALGLTVVAVPVEDPEDPYGSPYRDETDLHDGYFEIRGLPNGVYWVGVRYSVEFCWFPGTLEQAEADTVVVREFGTVAGVDWMIPIW